MNNLQNTTIVRDESEEEFRSVATMTDPVLVTAETMKDFPQFTEGTYIERAERTQAIIAAQEAGERSFEALDTAGEFDELRRIGAEGLELVETLRPTVERIAVLLAKIKAERDRISQGQSDFYLDGVTNAGMNELYANFVIRAEDFGDVLAGQLDLEDLAEDVQI